MSRGTTSIIGAAALVVALLPAPVAAGRVEPPADAPEITDPKGDARFGLRDLETPVDAEPAGDVLRAWFDHDNSNLTIYIETAAGPPSTYNLHFRVLTNPVRKAELYDYYEPACLVFRANLGWGIYNPEFASGWVYDQCNEVGGELKTSYGTTAKGTGLITMSVPRRRSPLLRSGSVITDPLIRVQSTFGDENIYNDTTVTIDRTRPGSDYRIGRAPEVTRRCEPFHPVPPQHSHAQRPERAIDETVVKITDRATRKHPVVFEYEHGMALSGGAWGSEGHYVIEEDIKYFNVQIDSRKPLTGLHVRLDWDTARSSDIDLLLYDEYGRWGGVSGNTNLPPEQASRIRGYPRGGPGYEYIPGRIAGDCEGFTLESWAYRSLGEEMTMKVWLGPIAGMGRP